jgi:cystathionine beta-lyase
MRDVNTYDFDVIIDRRDTDSLKWDNAFLKKYFKGEDLLPLWVADMDFQAPKPVIDALVERARHGLFGYCSPPSDEYKNSVISWFQRRHQWTIENDWIVFSPGIVPACNYIIQRFSKPGDKIIIQEPVYYPFAAGIRSNGRFVVSNRLILENQRYFMDFEGLENQLKDPSTKILILCSPHNPVGRVWDKKELIRLGEICLANDIIIVADEIHCDLIFPGYKHTPFAAISDEFASTSITCTAGSKTFNLAGLNHSNLIVPNSKLREEIRIQMKINAMTMSNVFGGIALQIAYNKCEWWLEELIKYLTVNLDFLRSYLKSHLPDVRVIEPEGTYLLWLDFRKFDLEPKELQKKLVEKAKVALDPGYIFGSGGEGFERINIACPRKTLQEALKRISAVF